MVRNYYPVILSVSRATDIPAFYGDWFLNCLKRGFFMKRNPFNGETYKIHTDKTRAIVFWTKHPEAFFKQLEEINHIIPNFYFQYTLNNYDSIIEKNLPDFDYRVNTFIKLSEIIGKDKVIWRFDPLVLYDDLNISLLSEKLLMTAEKLEAYTNKLVFSFVETEKYRKVKNKLKKAKVSIREFTDEEKSEIVKTLVSLSSTFKLELATCAEENDFSHFGIQKNKCIDDQLLKKLFPYDKQLADYLNDPKNLIDKGQREHCNCIKSKDTGIYNTCIHSCVYCYAVTSQNAAMKNFLNQNSIHA